MTIKKVSNVDRLIDASYSYLNNTLSLLSIFLLLRLFEIFVLTTSFSLNDDALRANLQGFFHDTYLVLKIAGILLIPYYTLCLLRKKIAELFFLTAGIITIIANLALQLYFATTKMLLGSDIFSYNTEELSEILRSSNSMNIINIIPFIVFPILFVALWHYIGKVKFVRGIYFLFYPLLAVAIITTNYSTAQSAPNGNRFNTFIASNKLGFFTQRTMDYIKESEQMNIAQTEGLKEDEAYLKGEVKTIDKKYPLLHLDETRNVLAPFFDTAKVKPNLVIILVESLGKAYSGKNARLGSFTPFLDSLSNQSLYFEHFLSTAGRTFAVLPSMLGSLPLPIRGFASLTDRMPNHNTLLSILNANGYSSNFVYGGDANFDDMAFFLKRQGVEKIVDLKSSWPNKSKLPPNDQGYSWGYGDKDILQKIVEINSNANKPFISIALTLAMHDPFRVPNQKYYNQKFQKIVEQRKLSDDLKEKILPYQSQLASVLYFDDALRNFFVEFSKLPSYNNTIFVITGDHSMPEIPISTQLERFRVPLVIYSPMLKRSANFKSVSTQFDVTPSLLAFLKERASISTPKYVHWIGMGLDTVRNFRNIHNVPLMENKNEQTTYLSGLYLISMNRLYEITPTMDLAESNNTKQQTKLANYLSSFKKMCAYTCSNNKLMPDSLLFTNRIKK